LTVLAAKRVNQHTASFQPIAPLPIGVGAVGQDGAPRQAGERPIMISPGCTFDPARVPADNLKAMVQAARRFGGTAA
jgi:hypothetical protein